MANALYDKGREGILDGSISWMTGNIKAVLVDAGQYTVNLATHANLSDIPTGARVATSGNLASKTATGGVADAADTVFTAVSGPSVEAIVLYNDTGTATSSRLLAYIDSSSNSTLPVTPNGGDITVQWSTGTSKIFKL